MIKDTLEMTGRDVWPLVNQGAIKLGGQTSGMIYGRLDCQTPRRHLKAGTYQRSRVFFESEAEAIEQGFRPCGHCLRLRHKKWKVLRESGVPWTLAMAREVGGESAEWDR